MKKARIEELRVLAVDDERITLSTIEKMLKTLGVELVVTQSSVQAALEFIRAEGDVIDVALVDMFMPESDGVDLIAGLKAAGYQGSVAVVSGGDDRVLAGAEILARTKDLEFLGVLKKPVSTGELEALLMQAVSPAV